VIAPCLDLSLIFGLKKKKIVPFIPEFLLPSKQHFYHSFMNHTHDLQMQVGPVPMSTVNKILMSFMADPAFQAVLEMNCNSSLVDPWVQYKLNVMLDNAYLISDPQTSPLAPCDYKELNKDMKENIVDTCFQAVVVDSYRSIWLQTPCMKISQYSNRYSENYFLRYNKVDPLPHISSHNESAWDPLLAGCSDWACWTRQVHILLLPETHMVVADQICRKELNIYGDEVRDGDISITFTRIPYTDMDRLEEVFSRLPHVFVPRSLEALHVFNRMGRFDDLMQADNAEIMHRMQDFQSREHPDFHSQEGKKQRFWLRKGHDHREMMVAFGMAAIDRLGKQNEEGPACLANWLGSDLIDLVLRQYEQDENCNKVSRHLLDFWLPCGRGHVCSGRAPSCCSDAHGDY
jgi:hypothetical protein